MLLLLGGRVTAAEPPLAVPIDDTEPSAVTTEQSQPVTEVPAKPVTNLPAKPVTEEPTQSVSTEQLLAAPPDGWALAYQFNNQQIRLTEYTPAGEGDEWKTRISFESDAKMASSDPIEVLLAEVKRQEDGCTFVQHFNVFSGYENGYPTSTRLLLCGEKKADKTGEVALLKAIQGHDFLYIISVTERVPPFPINGSEVDRQDVATWANYLSRIRLCDSESADHPCP